MQNKNKLCFVLFLAILVLNVNLCMGQEGGPLVEEVEFQIIDEGYLSGYGEESYLVIRDETEWTDVWERHSRTLMPTPCPEIDFSKNMVICAFMGERRTTGYSISIEKIYVEDEKLYVIVVKHHPPPNADVGQAITYPYIIVSLERLDLEVVFKSNGQVLLEFPTGTSMLFILIAITVAIVIYKQRVVKKPIS